MPALQFCTAAISAAISVSTFSKHEYPIMQEEQGVTQMNLGTSQRYWGSRIPDKPCESADIDTAIQVSVLHFLVLLTLCHGFKAASCPRYLLACGQSELS